MSKVNTEKSVFESWKLGNLTLKNRIIKAATFEGLAQGGVPDERLVQFHEKFAAGGAGVVTVAYGAVNEDARTFDHQMCMQDDRVMGVLKKVTSAIHKHGAAASLQLAHCGMQTRYSKLSSKPFSFSASWGLNPYGLLAGIPFMRPMPEKVIEQTCDDYAISAKRAVEAGFDMLELHMGHGYLFSQFMSPAYNKRRDKFGGNLENRMRFPRLALRRVREAVGPDVPIVVKLNLQDGFEGGSTLDDCIEASKIIEQDGDASLLVVTGGFSAKSPMYLFRGPSAIKPLIAIQKNLIAKLVYTLAAKKFPDMPFKEMFFLDDAKKVREAVKMPIALVGGIKSLANFKTVMHEDFDGIVLGRTLIHEPDLPKIYETGEQSTSGCISCNRCVAHIDSDDGVICPINVEMASEAA
ncbi:MAG: NADH:flavin oxidoreductase [Candidatus Micropelagos sp.]|uniref:NADH:flavin oxidoreductase n=1 Tax=PS1 clade bacterium TaxID=2175152 RepID=A0A368EM00_9PROT|nr:MAG: hypothetical protein CBC70_02350 [Alphaproteobacteria bacterium TMED110]RCL84932.1 MAG: NADH:flavin oxidoreductase [PS1 clade bacterium]HCN32425.1 NADH:flavin oxidoreductase [Rhodobiaceae bacterium]